MQSSVNVGNHEVDWGIVAFQIVICAIGIVGNLIVICIIFILKDYKKKVTHWYVLQLAIADSTFLLSLPFKIDEEIRGTWKYTEGMCKAKETVLFLNYYASILFLVVMSLDRYIAVCHGFSRLGKKIRSHFAAFVITGVVWGIALVFCMPIILYSGLHGANCNCLYVFPEKELTSEENCIKHGFEDRMDYCLSLNLATTTPNLCSRYSNDVEDLFTFGGSFGSGDDEFDFTNTSYTGFAPGDESNTTAFEMDDWERGGIYYICQIPEAAYTWRAFTLYQFVILFVLPFLIMAFCYFKIVAKVHRSRASVARHSGSGVHGGAQKQNNRVTLMCSMLVLLFFVCWLPFHTIHLLKIRGLSITRDQCDRVTKILALVAFCNSALNPYLYNFFGTGFAERIKQAKTRMMETFTSATWLPTSPSQSQL